MAPQNKVQVMGVYPPYVFTENAVAMISNVVKIAKVNRSQIVMGSDKCNNPGMKASAHDIGAASLPVSISSEDQEYIWLAARFLREQGAKRVWLFGSLAKGRRPQVHSDFDFAVEGLPDDRLFGSIGYLLQVLPRPVDIVEFENCSTLLREQILEHGIVLYDEN